MAEPGQVLAGRYELDHVLGRGGMATVYRAHDRELARPVAVKVLDPSREQAGDLLTKFRREARSAAILNHRNVVAVHDVGADGDDHFIVMELVEGVTLEDVIRDRGSLEPPRALAITQGILNALGAAHDAGLVHRDVKPGNVMFDTEGVVKVTDFGLARSPASRTAGRRVYGSAPFMAPEQAGDGPLDTRTDLYAAGCLLFAMLTGRPPFEGKTDLEVLYRHLNDPPPAPSDVRPELPTAIDALVLRALAKDPSRRYAGVEEFRSDIDRVASGRAPAAAEAELPDDELMQPQPEARSEVVAGARPGLGGTLQQVPITSSRVRGRKRMFGLVLLLLAAVIAMGVLLVTADEDTASEAADRVRSLAEDVGEVPMRVAEDDAPRPGNGENEASASGAADRSEPQRAGSDDDEGAESVAEAVSELVRVLAVGEREGEVREDAADHLARRGAVLVRAHRDDDTDAFTAELEQARDDVGRFEDGDAITSERADRVRQVLDEVEATVPG